MSIIESKPNTHIESIPRWIEESIYPRAREDRKPLLDVYVKLMDIEAALMRIEARMQPWYKRLYFKIRGMRWFTPKA